jgi:formylglycine-generating enzyme required for sulfatase activity
VPDPEYKEEVIHLDERYLPYIASVDGMTITFSSSLPQNLRPHNGDILLYEGISELFPEGFAGKVIEEGNRVTCEQAQLQDVYNKVVFFGNYVVVDKNNNDAKSPSYMLHRINDRTVGAGGAGGGGGRGGGGSWGDEGNSNDWGIVEDTIKDITIGTVKKSVKLELKRWHASVAIDYKVTPVFTIEFAYAFNFFNPVFFYKCTQKNNYEVKLKAGFNWEKKPEKDIFWGENQPDWIEVYETDYEGDENDDENSQSIILVNQEVPVPDFPLLKAGFKLGFFFEPKVEGEIAAGVTFKGSNERTFIYNLDKEHWLSLSSDWRDYLLPWRYTNMKYLEIGDKQYYKGPTTCEHEWFFEGSAKLSMWAGFIAAVNLSLGINEDAEIKEEAKIRIGPYVEGEINLNFLDGIADQSMHSFLKDSKIKTGFKLGFDLDYSAKLKWERMGTDVGTSWKQFSWSPQELFNQHEYFIFPEFTKPEYTINGNSLTCTSKVSRETLPNKLGFAVIDETGKEVRKYKDWSYFYSDKNNPYILSETFDDLDFANHLYTIVPTTRAFNFIEADVADDLTTTALCPNSNHPHLIDLGLPSGTKWLCSNVYADAPDDAGGYYQWGKPYKAHIYSDATYRAPIINTESYQGTDYDAATKNLGTNYVTPTLSQFNELFGNCGSILHNSTWGTYTKGIFLKGKNGNNLYLPFAGFMNGNKVNNSYKQQGFYLVSDAKDNSGNYIRKIISTGKDGFAEQEANAFGYSVRPVSAGKVSQVSFSHQEVVWDGVYVGQDSVQTVVVTNDGNSSAKITVSPSSAPLSTPFTVDSKSVGTFTIKPKERKEILVFFAPNGVGNFESLLNIQYEIDNACTVCKIPLKGKGISQYEPTTETFTVNGVSFKMVKVDGGTFQMGSTTGDSDEAPVHNVTLNSYYIGETEVTQALWTTVMGSNPSDSKGDNLPVEKVSWDDCQTFITKLNQLTGQTFRLPTEAEWEYAAKGGTKSQGYIYSGSNSIGNVAWYDDNSSKETHHVATKSPNELGIYDMSGNVYEWCQDWYENYSSNAQTNPIGPSSGSHRVNRGGSCYGSASYCLTANRFHSSPTLTNSVLGLRLALSELDPGPEPDDHEYVDLGLPSGTLWATCNVGANSPEEYGDYFAWGETTPKETYNWSTYKWCKGSGETMTKYCADSSYGYNGFTDDKTELDPEDDAATVNWGINWRTPTIAQIQELLDNCTMEHTILHDRSGTLVRGPNGKSIFLPPAGVREGTGLSLTGSYYYWSRSLSTYQTDGAGDLYFYRFDWSSGDNIRSWGQSVRPVRVNKNDDTATETFTVNDVSFKMIPVESGTFQMGSEDGDDDEKPVHSVTLSSYYIGQTEVTQALWKAVMGDNPSYFSGDNLPVEGVRWDDCQTFITKLNQLTGKTFRLPTEAEWEFAARGGNKSKGYQYSGSSNIDAVAWYCGNSNGTIHPVGIKQANELGIYDMSGNVWEWCQDWHGSYSSSSQNNPVGPSSGSRRVIRGGGRYSDAGFCRSALRADSPPGIRDSRLGLRLVLSE